MTKVYLGESGYWLPVSLTGRTAEIGERTINGGDYYTGAPRINSADELRTMIATKRGYIILDTMAKNRVGRDYLEVLKDPRVNLVFRKITKNDLIELYHFN